MTRRRKHRGHRRDTLFDFQPGGDTTETTEPHSNPLLIPCPACHAGRGQPCTTAGRTRRTAHPSRHDAANRPEGTDS